MVPTPGTRQKAPAARQNPSGTCRPTPVSGDNVAVAEFVGRSEPLARLVAAHRRRRRCGAGHAASAAGLVLVTGEAGIGKTALLRRFAAEVERSRRNGRVGHLLGRRPGAGLVAVDRGAARR